MGPPAAEPAAAGHNSPVNRRGHMPTGPSSDSASPSPESDSPLAGSRHHSWLARGGGWGHPITWATVGLVLLGGSGAAVLLHEPDGRAQAQTAYCGLVTCAVLRSTAATSSVPAGAAHPAYSAHPVRPTPAPSSPVASTRAPAPPATTVPTQAAPSPRPAAASTSRPAPRPALSRWPWPVWWPPSGWWGPGPGHGRGYPAVHAGGFGSWPGGRR
jgi:hypothetical protein